MRRAVHGASAQRHREGGRARRVRPPPDPSPVPKLFLVFTIRLAGRPISCVPGYSDVINPHTVGSLTIPRASIKWV